MTVPNASSLHPKVLHGKTREPGQDGEDKGRLAMLCLATLGVVYGDIGTNPLFAFRECLYGITHIPATAANVLGLLSLIFWALVIVISIKYVTFMLRADNDGKGGVLALLALLSPWRDTSFVSRKILVALALFGAGLLYGGGMITPAISVLSAIEGLEVATPDLKPYVVPLTASILILLFMFQRKGTEKVGMAFGPVMLIWFITLAVLGLRSILHRPEVLAAVSPAYAIGFFANNGWTGFLILGAVFLVIPGGEALYAEMGHFGRLPIRLTWFSVAMPAEDQTISR
jgi:KUP system potassium uptake protein